MRWPGWFALHGGRTVVLGSFLSNEGGGGGGGGVQAKGGVRMHARADTARGTRTPHLKHNPVNGVRLPTPFDLLQQKNAGQRAQHPQRIQHVTPPASPCQR